MMTLGDKLFFPRVHKDRCHPSVSSACCTGRREAVRAGTFEWDLGRGGWINKDLPTRTMRDEVSWRSEIDSNGVPYLLEICSFCGSALPELFKPPKIVSE